LRGRVIQGFARASLAGLLSFVPLGVDSAPIAAPGVRGQELFLQKATPIPSGRAEKTKGNLCFLRCLLFKAPREDGKWVKFAFFRKIYAQRAQTAQTPHDKIAKFR
jgi:hypothetical protein